MVSKTPPRRLQDALKSPQDAPKSLQDAPRCLQDTPVGGQKTLIFLVFFKVFDVQGLPGAILARHGLQDDFKSPWNVFHGFQDTFRNLSDGSKGLQDTPKSLQDAPKTCPREVQKSKISSCCSNLLAVLGLLGGSSLNMAVKTLPRCLQERPKCA